MLSVQVMFVVARTVWLQSSFVGTQVSQHHFFKNIVLFSQLCMCAFVNELTLIIEVFLIKVFSSLFHCFVSLFLHHDLDYCRFIACLKLESMTLLILFSISKFFYLFIFTCILLNMKKKTISSIVCSQQVRRMENCGLQMRKFLLKYQQR